MTWRLCYGCAGQVLVVLVGVQVGVGVVVVQEVFKRSVGKRQDHICSALSASSRRCIRGASRCSANLASTFARSAARKIRGSAVLAAISLRLRCLPDRTSPGTSGVCRMRARRPCRARRMSPAAPRSRRALPGPCVTEQAPPLPRETHVPGRTDARSDLKI